MIINREFNNIMFRVNLRKSQAKFELTNINGKHSCKNIVDKISKNFEWKP